MITRLQNLFSTLLAILLALNTLTLSGVQAAPGVPTPAQAAPPAQAGMPDELLRAFLDASAQASEPSADGYRARSGGLDFTLDAGGLHASGEGFALSLALDGFGREGQIAPVSDPEIAQTDGRLEYRRGSLTEWYRNTSLGVEQGFTLHQAPNGAGALILQLDLLTDFEDRDVAFLRETPSLRKLHGGV